ncbi:MAG TPA: MFS transporter [Streptosporangiaceae bacterium]|nr:MFS transporter [Streptosporangiaceae bacterium]
MSFAATGVTSAAFPASLPATAARLGEDPARLLPGISVLFGGLLVGVLLVSAAGPRTAPRLLGAGAVLQAAALLGLAVAPDLTGFYLACGVAGVGFGLAEASGSALARRLAAERTTAALAGLNGAAAISAAACPVIVAAAAPGTLPLALGPLLLVPLASAWLAVRAWPVPRPDRERPSTDHRGQADPAGPGATPAGEFGVAEQATPAGPGGTRQVRAGVLPGGALLFLFVGAETVFSGWSSVLPLEVLRLSPRAAALGTSAFWILMAAGRYLAAALLRRGVPPRRYLALGLAAAAVELAIAAASGRTAPGLQLTLAALATASLAPGYALILGPTLARLGDHAVQRMTGFLVAAGSAGGSVIPLAVALGVGAAIPALLLTQAGLLLACAALAARPGTWPAAAPGAGSA